MERAQETARHCRGAAVQPRCTALRVQFPQRRHVRGRRQTVDVGVGEVTAGETELLQRTTDCGQDHSEVVGEVVVTEVQGDEVWEAREETEQPAEAASVTARTDTAEDVQRTVVKTERRQPFTRPASRQRPVNPGQAEINAFQTEPR